MTLTMTVDRSGSSPAGRFSWERAASAWSKQASPLGLGMLRAHAPMRTGKLRQGISARHEPGPGSYQIVYYTTVSYAKYVIGGTRPHVITVKNARVLRWTDRAGNPSFARSVQHPGTKPDPFPERAFAPIGPAVSRLFAEAVKESMDL